MAYDAPSGNVTSMQDIYSYFNNTVDGFFFPGVVIALFFIVVIKLMYRTDNVGQSFTAAAFIAMIISVLLKTVNLVPLSFMVMWIILTAAGAVWMHYENSKFS